ncbi:AbrB/MazE/SpoVT family DNA-binding domain-containing protein [Caldinitratiruptor microaerophilus]|uniref:SpoVT-AbrB domain-containing protein n=1 Tax=Caldinitratiruptor microaerophilus TaxID=671077 RepID=A0AA35CLJ2_9FIRM|nr:AbrB/MazE/SpoVT family DNA-binding domain-containing protein [Caldinitratiruptor microaerophilus]BDG59516.1 hypothetical protein caldi_06060 [Caldinitratiruptor microaerophilus]
MPTYRAKLTRKGQVTVPREVRRALGVGAGDEITFQVDPDGVWVTPVRERSRFREFEGRWREPGGEPPEAVDSWLRRLRGHESE